MSDEIKGAELVKILFRSLGDGKYKCLLCESLDRDGIVVSKNGYNNLEKHMETKLHVNDWKKEYYMRKETDNLVSGDIDNTKLTEPTIGYPRSRILQMEFVIG